MENIIKENIKNNVSKTLKELENVKIVKSKEYKVKSSSFRSITDFDVKLENSINPIIYIIRLEDLSAKELYEKFENLEKGNFKLSQNNIKKYNDDRLSISKCLYVGTSKDFIKRIKLHLGLSSASVYSLHLNRWDDKLDYGLLIETYEVINVKNGDNVISKDVTELIEQEFWNINKPIFGKKSGQN